MNTRQSALEQTIARQRHLLALAEKMLESDSEFFKSLGLADSLERRRELARRIRFEIAKSYLELK